MSSMPLSVDLKVGKLDYTFLPFEVGIECVVHYSNLFLFDFFLSFFRR